MTLQRLEDLLETAYRTQLPADWAAYQAARMRVPTEECGVCGGVGRMQRITDRAMVKCLVCHGEGRRPS